MTIAWIGWLVAFVVIEAIAIKSKARGDTLSEHVWSWFSIRKSKNNVFTYGFLLFWLCLTIHFVTGGAI